MLGPLSKKHRVIALSLRHFFPEHWDGVGNDYLMAQHVADVIGFIEKLNAGPVDLMGHSRGGHIGFRVAQAAAGSAAQGWCWPNRAAISTPSLRAGEPRSRPLAAGGRAIPRRCRDGPKRRHRWRARDFRRWRSTATAPGRAAGRAKQQLRDNVFTLLGQVGENRKPFTQERSGIDQHADAVDRRRRHQGRAGGDLARAGGAYSGRADRRDPGHAPLDVRTGAAGILRRRAGFSAA